MLLERDRLIELLISPADGSQLKFDEQTNTYTGVELSDCYKSINQIPVLIDFSESILSPEIVEQSQLKSLVPRRRNNVFTRNLKKIFNSTSSVTNENMGQLLKQLELLDKPKLLIIGGGTIGKDTEQFIESEKINVVSFDIYASPHVHFLGDAHHIPLKSNTFDAVIIQAVLEHVVSPKLVVEEIHRVLSTNGIVYAETPFMQQVHEGAFDFTRYSESGHRFLFRHFETLNSGVVGGPGTALLWSIDNFSKSVFRSRTAGKIAKILFFWLSYFDKFIDQAHSVDAACGVFFMGRKRLAKMHPSELIQYYQGAQK